MAVTISLAAAPGGATSSGGIATYSSQSIGAASEERFIVAIVLAEDIDISGGISVTIDFGSGDTAMTALTADATLGNVHARLFGLLVPAGATATFKVNFIGAVDALNNRLFVFRVGGALPTPAANGTDTSTDMDATDPLTTGSITIPTDGAFLAGISSDNPASTATWANATEGQDTSGGNFHVSTATRTTPGTVTVTCTGTVNGEDGALAWVIFSPRVSLPFFTGRTRFSNRRFS